MQKKKKRNDDGLIHRRRHLLKKVPFSFLLYCVLLLPQVALLELADARVKGLGDDGLVKLEEGVHDQLFFITEGLWGLGARGQR